MVTNKRKMLQEAALHHRVIRMLQAPYSVEYKTAEVEWLLNRGLAHEVNDFIPELGCTLFQHCVKMLSDRELSIIEKLQPHADLSLRDADGLSVFDLLVPVQWSKKDIFLGLLESLDDPARTCIILNAAISAGSFIESVLSERLRLARWELQRKAMGFYGQF